MTQIELTDNMTCNLINHSGDELMIVNAARVSFNETHQEMTEKDEGLIRFLMKNRHASPFEHCFITFRIEAPIMVVREWMRHRTQSFNEWSGRYSQLQPRFYAPGYDRPIIQVGKPGAYRFEKAEEDEKVMELHKELRFSYQTAWNCYEYLLEQGVAKEVARLSLPVSVFTSWYASANLRNWLSFLSLRTDPQALYEIRQLASIVEYELVKLYPVTLDTWNQSGRGGL